eukprot:scaffold274467_cov34-Tisochrysis_lutea.AAC.2
MDAERIIISVKLRELHTSCRALVMVYACPMQGAFGAQTHDGADRLSKHLRSALGSNAATAFWTHPGHTLWGA